jgi:ABC-type amino acid transport substrate-binding protein
MKCHAQFLVLLCLGLAVLSQGWAQQTVRVAVFSGPFPSLFVDDQGQAQGVYVDLLSRILAEAGYEPQFIVHDSFQAAMQAVVNGTMDLIPAVARRPEREATLDFNAVAFTTGWGQVFVPDRSIVESILDLRNRVVGVMEGDQLKDRFDETMASFDVPYQRVFFPDVSALVAGIADGSVDAGILTNTINHREFPIRATGIVFAPTSAYVATTKSRNPELLAEIDRILGRTKADHESYYYGILEKWTTAPASTKLPRWVLWSAAAVITLALLLLVFTILLRQQVRRGGGTPGPE